MTDLRTALSRRPWWMQLLLGFCLFMALVYMPFDLFLIGHPSNHRVKWCRPTCLMTRSASSLRSSRMSFLGGRRRADPPWRE